MFAPGIANKKVKSTIPTLSDVRIPYSIQEHKADKAGLHYDMRLAMQGNAYSWATRKGLPEEGQRVLWIRQPDHTVEYMDFSGVIEDGYGKGRVKTVKSGKLHILESSNSKIKFNIYDGSGVSMYALINTGADNWLCLNYSANRDNRPDVPIKKSKTLNGKFEEVDLENEDQFLTPKIDGSASYFRLDKKRGVEVFSYRDGKRGLINRTYRYPDLYKKKVPSELHGLGLWGESFVSDSEGKALSPYETSGFLNMNVDKANELMKSRGLKFDNILYNVDKPGITYQEKIPVLKLVNSLIPELKLPVMAQTLKDKKNLVESIKLKKHPQTIEGWVLWDSKKEDPIKLKLKEDSEFYIQDFLPGNGKYFNTLGKLVVTEDKEGLGKKINVGTGFDNITRNEIWNNKSAYKGKRVTVEYQSKLPSGSLRMPSFKKVRENEYL
jgi:hypothetical protein